MVDAAVKVHRELGPGLVETVYEVGAGVGLFIAVIAVSRHSEHGGNLGLQATPTGFRYKNLWRPDLL